MSGESSSILDGERDALNAEAKKTIASVFMRPKAKTFPITDEYISTFEKAAHFSYVTFNFNIDQERKDVLEFLLHEKESLEGFRELLNTPEVSTWIKWGSQFESKCPIIKTKCRFKGTIDPLDFLLYLNEKRKDWDKNIILLEEIAQISGEVTVNHYAVKSPLLFTKSKDFVEKRIQFFEEGTYYSYSSSVPNGVLPPTDQFQRCETIFSGTILAKEEDNFVYYSFSQVDLKVFLGYLISQIGGLPAACITTFVPGIAKNFYKEINRVLERKKQPAIPIQAQPIPHPIS